MPDWRGYDTGKPARCTKKKGGESPPSKVQPYY
jgi:hypothetical protein